jgi:hypothetical protein
MAAVDKKQDPAGGDDGDAYLPMAEQWASAFGTGDKALQVRLLNLLLPALTQWSGVSTDETVKTMIAAMRSIGPRDGVEGMLAAQMIASHEAAMECLGRAATGSDPDYRALDLNNAARLMQIHARQIEALGKHRGRGQQKIVVEHVTVESGGQAIVGNVRAASGRGNVR